MALLDPPHNPTEAQELFKTSLTADVIHNREISFPPNVGYFPVPPHTFDRAPFDLELAYASSASVSGLMAALPQWNLDPASEAVDKKPWRVIWPYHPILNTWSKGSGNTPTVDKFKHIDDLDEATVAELPPGHEDYSQGALIFPLYRIIAYHTVQQVRYKFAQWVELQLSQRDLAPYFHDLKLPDRGPVPLIPPEVVTRIAQADHHAMLVMHGKRNAHNSFELKKYCNKQEIPFPLTTAAAPGPPPATKANYPSLSETTSAKSATKPYSKPPPAALSAPVSLPKKPTNYAMSLTTQRPIPPPPKQTAPSSSTTLPPEQPVTPAPEESADVHMADPNSTEMSFEAMLQAQDVAMTPAQELYPEPMDTSTSPTHFASLNTPVRHSTSTHLRPTIHPPTRPTPDAPLVPAEQRTPSLFQRFAEVFRPLPFIGNLFKLVPDSSSQLHETSVMSRGLDIFRWLFPSSSPGTDTTQALTDDMPLASMISACVDVEASFADPMQLSRPQICPEPPDVAPLPLPSPSDSSFDPLVHFLHEHVSDHLRRMQQIGTFTEVFATFIVGPPDHSKTGYIQAPFDCTPIRSINFLGPILLISPPSLKAISSATSAWINSSPSCPHILPILRLCRPPSSNLEHLNAPKLRLHRSHANPLHVVPLPLRLHRIPCHHIPNRPLLSLTLQVSRSLLRILPPPLPPTLSPLHSPPSLILRYRYLTPLLVVAPLAGTQIPFSQNSYQIVIPLGSNDQGLPR